MPTLIRHLRPTAAVIAVVSVACFTHAASASPLSLFPFFPPALAPQAAPVPQDTYAYAPPTPEAVAPDDEDVQESVAPSGDPRTERLARQVVSYPTREAPGTIVIDTPHTYLYYVLGNGRAIRYGIGVGRQGFTWSGVKEIARKAEWPDWYPPPEMIKRQPYLPRVVAGGPGNPLGARAMYIGGTEYRIHGTNDPSTIGKFVSSGCIRLKNADAIDLYNRVQVGAKVVVLPMTTHSAAR